MRPSSTENGVRDLVIRNIERIRFVMVFDFHAHFFPEQIVERAMQQLKANMPGFRSYSDGTLGGLLRSMDDAGIDRTVTLPVATKPAQVESINQLTAACATERIIPFGALHPLLSDLEEQMAFLVDAGIRGFKLHPEYQDFHVDDPACARMYELAQEAGLVIVFHAGWDPGPFSNDHATPRALRRVIERYPHLTVVAAHMGGLEAWGEVERYLVGTPVYFDTSAVPGRIQVQQFVRIVNAHGADRVLFGTDSPWFSQRAARQWIEQMPLSDEQKTLLLSSNAQTVLQRSH